MAFGIIEHPPSFVQQVVYGVCPTDAVLGVGSDSIEQRRQVLMELDLKQIRVPIVLRL